MISLSEVTPIAPPVVPLAFADGMDKVGYRTGLTAAAGAEAGFTVGVVLIVLAAIVERPGPAS